MHVGFTGTRFGMTDQQIKSIAEIVDGLPDDLECHHGDCVGADEEFHTIVRIAKEGARIRGHLPENEKHRAWCDFDFEEEPLDYKVRNRRIVNASDLMIAGPKEMKEAKRSGTWMTIRYALRQGKEMLVVFPDGRVVSGKLLRDEA